MTERKPLLGTEREFSSMPDPAGPEKDRLMQELRDRIDRRYAAEAEQADWFPDHLAEGAGAAPIDETADEPAADDQAA